ncbi:hypothetical protein GCM10020295_37840 [Streptomyces cinereospinus]
MFFERGGFDLQVGNPPWLKFEWDDDLALAEYDAWFGLEKQVSEEKKEARRDAVLASGAIRRNYLSDVASWAGVNEHLGSPIEHPVLAGLQTNLYVNFMERAWRNLHPRGSAALIHEENHFSVPKGEKFRAETYARLRRHFQYGNNILLFEDVDNNKNFGVSVYGAPREVRFVQIARAVHPSAVDGSFSHVGKGGSAGNPVPGGRLGHAPASRSYRGSRRERLDRLGRAG